MSWQTVGDAFAVRRMDQLLGGSQKPAGDLRLGLENNTINDGGPVSICRFYFIPFRTSKPKKAVKWTNNSTRYSQTVEKSARRHLALYSLHLRDHDGTLKSSDGFSDLNSGLELLPGITRNVFLWSKARLFYGFNWTQQLSALDSSQHEAATERCPYVWRYFIQLQLCTVVWWSNEYRFFWQI